MRETFFCIRHSWYALISGSVSNPHSGQPHYAVIFNSHNQIRPVTVAIVVRVRAIPGSLICGDVNREASVLQLL